MVLNFYKSINYIEIVYIFALNIVHFQSCFRHIINIKSEMVDTNVYRNNNSDAMSFPDNIDLMRKDKRQTTQKEISRPFGLMQCK